MDVEFHLHAIVSTLRHEAEQDLHLVELKQAAQTDNAYQELLRVIQHGFPQAKNDLPLAVRPYWSVRDRLAVDDGYALCGCRLVIPASLRKTMLERLHHDSHQGMTRTKQRAR